MNGRLAKTALAVCAVGVAVGALVHLRRARRRRNALSSTEYVDTRLPRDVFELCAEYLTCRERLLVVERVCRSWYHASARGKGWQRLDLDIAHADGYEMCKCQYPLHFWLLCSARPKRLSWSALRAALGARLDGGRLAHLSCLYETFLEIEAEVLASGRTSAFICCAALTLVLHGHAVVDADIGRTLPCVGKVTLVALVDPKSPLPTNFPGPPTADCVDALAEWYAPKPLQGSGGFNYVLIRRLAGADNLAVAGYGVFDLRDLSQTRQLHVLAPAMIDHTTLLAPALTRLALNPTALHYPNATGPSLNYELLLRNVGASLISLHLGFATTEMLQTVARYGLKLEALHCSVIRAPSDIDRELYDALYAMPALAEFSVYTWEGRWRLLQAEGRWRQLCAEPPGRQQLRLQQADGSASWKNDASRIAPLPIRGGDQADGGDARPNLDVLRVHRSLAPREAVRRRWRLSSALRCRASSSPCGSAPYSPGSGLVHALPRPPLQ